MGNGSFSQSALVVQYPVSAQRDLPRSIYPTVQYPLALGSRATFGVAFANGGEDAVVTAIDLEVPGGYDLQRHGGKGAEIFAVAPGEAGAVRLLGDTPDVGAWRVVDGRHVRWSGHVPVEAGTARSFLVSVPITSDASQWTSIEGEASPGVESTLTFGNGFVSSSSAWGASPGVFAHEVRPASAGDAADGYPHGGAGPFAVVGAVRGSRVAVSNPGSYGVSPSADATDLHSAIANSSFAVSRRMAPLGSFVHVDADLQSLSTELALRGVHDPVVNVSLYAPPSLGCVPTKTWLRTASDLPRAAVTAMVAWDALDAGAPSLLLAAEDRTVYRVEPSGQPSWSTTLDAVPTALAVADTSPAGAVLVGDSAGRVHRLDALDGRVTWSADVGSLEPFTTGAGGVRALVPDEARGRVLVGTADGGLAVIGFDGAVVARVSAAATPLAPGYAQLAAAASGDAFALNLSAAPALERRDASLAPLASWASPGASAFAAGPARVLVADGDVVRALDAATLAEEDAQAVGAAIVLARPFDVDADGAMDLVAGLADARLVVVDGASFEARAWAPPAVVPAKADAPTFGGYGERVCAEGAAGAGARVFRYGDSGACALDPALSPPAPLAVDARGGRVAYAFRADDAVRVAVLGEDLRVVSVAGLAAPPTHVALATWAGQDAVLLAYADGAVEARAAATGTLLQTMRVTDFAGRFTLAFPVPMGAFFGSHLLVAAMEWTGPAGAARSASLVDWFEVVDADGSPVANPHYRLDLVVADPAMGAT